MESSWEIDCATGDFDSSVGAEVLTQNKFLKCEFNKWTLVQYLLHCFRLIYSCTLNYILCDCACDMK